MTAVQLRNSLVEKINSIDELIQGEYLKSTLPNIV